ncbi:MAG: PBP1A family penicillin-binding protein [Candidatus Sericytochromatia bacterium]|nr:PBP1A family penicillin-binding protein [Candidatus Sericytochromatia bacterium]
MSTATAPTTPETSTAQRVALFILILLLKLFLAVVLLVLAVAGGLATGAYMRIQSLPDITQLQYYDPHERSEIVTTSGVVLKQIFGEENRKVVLLKDLPAHVPNAVLAIEDARFNEHTGVDPIGILRAFKANLDSNDTVQGGSTITQQVVKNLFLTSERSYARKAAEAVLSVQVDQTFSKEQILELYLNLIYFGHNAYGIEAAAETYFGKSAKDLAVHEAALIAGLIRGPEIFSPYRNYAQAKKRQVMTLGRMVEARMLSAAEAEAAKKEPVKLYGIRRGMQYPYYTTYVMHYLKQHFSDTELETKGLRITTALDTRLQTEGQRIVNAHLERLKRMNVQQGALVTVDATTGHVLAMVGGTDFGYGDNEFNRAYQAHRQTGSAFKPFVYVTGFENGYTPYTTEVDGPTVYKTGPRATWSPQNYGRSYRGTVSIRQALASSVNVVAVKVMDKTGIDKVIEMTQRLGIKSEVRPFLSSALGASEITPLEMTQAYGAFANDGILIEASPILKVEDKHGNVLLDHTARAGKKVLDQDVVRALNHSLLTVVNAGTGAGARIAGHQIAGKTGTTSSHRDAWFVGYTPRYVTTVWVGNDTPTRMYGATGGGFCAPIWREYMQVVLKDHKMDAFPKELPLRRKRIYSKGTHIAAKEPDEDADKKAVTRQVRDTTATPAAVAATRVQPRAAAPQAPPPVAQARQPSGRLTGHARSGSRLETGGASGAASN